METNSAVDNSLLESIRLTENSRPGDVSEDGAVGEYQMRQAAWEEASRSLVNRGILDEPAPFSEASNSIVALPHAQEYLRIEEQRLAKSVPDWDNLSNERKRLYLAGSYNAGVKGFTDSLNRAHGNLDFLDLEETKNYLRNFQVNQLQINAGPKGYNLKIAEEVKASDVFDTAAQKIRDNAERVKELYELHQLLLKRGDYIEGFKKAVDLGFAAPGDLLRGALAGEPGTRMGVEEFTGQASEPNEDVRATLGSPIGAFTQGFAGPFGAFLPAAMGDPAAQNSVVEVLTDPWAYVGLAPLAAFGRKSIEATNGSRLLYAPVEGQSFFNYQEGARVVTPEGFGTISSIKKRRGHQDLTVELDGTQKTLKTTNLDIVPLQQHFGLDVSEEGLARIANRLEPPDIQQISERYQAKLKELEVPAGGGRLSDLERERRAQDILEQQKISDEVLTDVQVHQAANAQEVRAGIILEDELMSDTIAQASRFLMTGLPEDRDAFMKFLTLFGEIDPGLRGLIATGARAERSAGTSVLSKEAGQILREGETATPEQIAVRLLQLRDAASRHQFLKQGSKFSWKKFLIDDIYLGSLVSNPLTTMNVFLANQSYIGLQMVENAFAGLMPGKSTSIFEGPAFLIGYLSSWGDLLAFNGRFGKFVQEAKQKGLDTKMGPMQFGFMQTEGLTPLEKSAEAFGAVFRLGRLGIQSVDLIARYNMREATKRQLAIRKAMQEARGTMGKTRFVKPVEFAKRVRAYYNQIKAVPGEAILNEANLRGSYTAMAQNLEGSISRHVQGFGQTALGKVIMPFMAVSWRVGAATGERTPLALLSPNVWREIRAGGARAKVATAKLSLGSAMASWVALNAANRYWTDDVDRSFVTPETLINPRQEDFVGNEFKGRAIGMRDPKTGKYQYISCQPADPICGILSFGGNIAQFLTYADEDDPLVEEVATFMTSTMLNIVSNPIARDELEALADALFGPEPNIKRLKTWAERKAASFVPLGAASAQYNRIMEEFRTVSDGLWERMKSRMPIGVTGKPLWINAKGERIRNPVGYGPDFVNQTVLDWLSPLRLLESDNPANLVQEDPVLSEFAKQRYWPASPRRTMGAVHLSMEQWMRRRDLFGNMKIAGKTLMESLEELINSRIYQEGPRKGSAMDTVPGGIEEKHQFGLRKTLLEDRVNMYRKAVDAQLMNEFRSIFLQDRLIKSRAAGKEMTDEEILRLDQAKRIDDVKARKAGQAREFRLTIQ